MLADDFRPYLIRAFYDYINDLGLTAYIHVFVNKVTQVPLEYVQEEAITLNISPASTAKMQLKNDEITFSARFAGQVRDIVIPIGHVLAIYAKERPDLILTFPLAESKAPAAPVKPTTKAPASAAKAGEKSSASHQFLKVVKKTSKKE